MNKMKLLGITLIFFGLTQCGSTKFVKTPPFKITKAVFKNWVGGQPGVGGLNVFVYYTSKKSIEFDSMYFNGKATKIEVNENGKVKYIAGRYNIPRGREKRDIILHSDPKKEIENNIPKTKKIPFELKENEAVVSYKEGNEIKYYKIENIKEIAPDFYPQAPPRREN